MRLGLPRRRQREFCPGPEKNGGLQGLMSEGLVARKKLEE